MENKFDPSSILTIILNLQQTHSTQLCISLFQFTLYAAHPLKREMDVKISDPSIKVEALSKTGVNTRLSVTAHNEKQLPQLYL